MKKSGASSKERRRSPRQPCELWANWVRRTGDVEATVADLSERGLFLQSSQLPQMGELVRLEVYPPGEMTPLGLVAVVRFTKRFGSRVGFGVELHAVDEATKERWQALHASLRRSGSPRPADSRERR